MKQNIIKQLKEANTKSGGHNGIYGHKFKDIHVSINLAILLNEMIEDNLITCHDGVHGKLYKIKC